MESTRKESNMTRNIFFILFAVMMLFTFVTVNNVDELITFTLSFLAIVFFIIAMSINIYSDKTEIKKLITNINEFKVKERPVVSDIDFFSLFEGIAYSEHKKEFYRYHRNKLDQEFHKSIIPFKNIVEVEYLEDGKSISKVNKKGLLVGSAIGGALTGGVGAIVGAMSADRVQNNIVNKFYMVVKVENMLRPRIEYQVVREEVTGVKRDSQVFTLNKTMADKWMDRFKLVIMSNNK